MSITLVTGTPGAGKTLYTVSKLVQAEVGRVIKDGDKEVSRRIMVGGIPRLLLDHEPIVVPHIKDDTVDKWSGIERKPGEPPQDVEHRADNWWLWCMPGDLIVIDEAWQVFRAAPSGRKLPDYLDKLAVHRHYGVDFIVISQGPAQLHVFLRALVDRHLFVRRLFRGGSTVVYEWDHCASHTATKVATKTFWRHDRKAFGLYASSQLHVKGTAKVPFFIPVLLLVVLLLPGLVWYAYKRRTAPLEASKPAAVTHADDKAPGDALRPVLAEFVAPVGKPAFASSVVPRATWPEAVAGCWSDGPQCSCVTQEMPPRVIRDREALCLAVVNGDLVPPLSHPRPSRVDAITPEAAASSPGAV
ncbi:MAG: zonular occludens toxin domain-containing protein [Pseudomonadota bacterium]